MKTTKTDKEYVSLVSYLPLRQHTNNSLIPVTFTGILLPLPTIPLLLRVLTAVSAQFFVCHSGNRTAPAARPDPGVTWHRILSFNNGANNYLRNLLRGSRVYVEANLEIREPDRDAEPGSPAATRQVFLRHGMSPTTRLVGFTLITLQRASGSSKAHPGPQSMARGAVEAARKAAKNR